MANYTFRFPGRDAGKTITVYDATNTQVASGAADANGVFMVSLSSGDYYAMAPDGQYRRGDSDAPQSVESSGLTATFAPKRMPSGYTGSGAGAYDPTRNLYMPSGWTPAKMRRTRIAQGQALAGTGEWQIGVIGDSIDAGTAITPADSWPTQLGTLLTGAGYTKSGTGVVCPMNAFTATIGNDSRWSFTGTWNYFVSGSNVSNARYSSTAGNTATFTSDVAGTTVDLYWLGASVTFTYSIDGAAAVTVNGSNPQNAHKTTITGLSNTTHTVVFTVVSGNCFLVGVDVHGSAGFRIHNAAIGSSTSTQWVQNQTYSPLTSVLTYPTFDTLFIKLGTNDWGTGAGLAATPGYTTNMQSLVASFPNTDVILVSVPPAVTSFAGGIPITSWIQAQYNLADTLGVPLFDLNDMLGTQALSSALYMPDGVHLKKQGCSLIARRLQRILD